MTSHRLYLVRHGENTANLTKEFSCRKVDYSLTVKGELQARQTAEHFAGKGIDAIYTSPLKRAVETAEIMGRVLQRDVVIVEEFREVDVGELEGRPATAEDWRLYQSIFDDWFAGKRGVAFPGGECRDDAWRRMRAGLRRVLSKHAAMHVIVVGHGGQFTATLQDWCTDVDVDWLRHRPSHNCSITEVAAEWRDETVRGALIRWASTAHLDGEAADLVPGVPETAPPRPRL